MGAPLLLYTAQYDAVGNPTRMTDPEGENVIEYDSLDRLVRITRGPPDNTVEDYDYNALGALKLNAGAALDMKRPRLDGGGLADSAVPGTFNGQPVVVDTVGRITSLGGTTLTYTQRGQLLSATAGATTVTYGLDSFNRRIARDAPGLTEMYVIEDDNIVATTNFGASVQDRYLYDGIDHPLRLERAGQKVYFEIDLAGNVRRLRGIGGNDLGGYKYSAFGKTVANTATVDQPMRWKSRWLDPVTAIYDVRARQWSPGAGLFTAIDEYAFADTHSTLWSWPAQNPVLFVDPAGRGVPAAFGGAAALFGFGGGSAGAAAAGAGGAGGGLFAGVSTVALPVGFVGVGVFAIGYAVYDISVQIDEFEHPTIVSGPRAPTSEPQPGSPVTAEDVFDISKGGKQNVKDTGVMGELLRRLSQSTNKDPCFHLKEMLDHANGKGDTCLADKIIATMKAFGCRNVRKRGRR